MTEEKFKVGDVVRVKSGGPSMTIIEVMREQMGANIITLYTCGYFDKKDRFHKAYVTQDSLIKN